MTVPANPTPAGAAPASSNGTQAATPKPLSFRDASPSDDQSMDAPTVTAPSDDEVEGDEVNDDEEGDDDADDDDTDDDEEGDGESEESDSEGDEDGESSDEEEPSETDEPTETDTPDGIVDEIAKEIGPDGKIAIKVGGQLQKFTWEQMKNLVSSGAHHRKQYDTEMQKIETKRKELIPKEKEIATIQREIGPVYKLVKEKDIEGAIYGLAKHAKLSTLQVRRQLREQMLPAIAERLGIDKAEIAERLKANEGRNTHLDTLEENSFFKSETERLAKESAPKPPDEKTQIQEAVRNLQLEHGFSRQQISWAVNFIEKEAEKSGSEPSVSLDRMVDLIRGKRLAERSFDAVEAVRPELVEDNKFIDRVFRKAKKNPDWTTGRLARWVDKVARSDAAQRKDSEKKGLHADLGRKVEKSRLKSRLQNPSGAQNKAMKFSDFQSDDESNRLE